MKSVWLSPYTLQFKNSARKRQGYLLKLSTDDFSCGYADIFPWPEFGDPSIDQIKELIGQNNVPPLLVKSFSMAQKDGEARRDKVSLLDGLRIKNHFLVTDLNSLSGPVLKDVFLKAQDEGFNRFKIKVCGDFWFEEFKKINEALSVLNSDSRLRLDCNLKAPKDFFSQIRLWDPYIEFVEDPFVNPKEWPMDDLVAYDRPPFEFEAVRTDWQIIKPAHQNSKDAQAKQLVFTSSLDHPVGMAHAFLEASCFGEQKWDYGLMSHNSYEPNDFYPSIIEEGPYLSFLGGYGIGFKKELESQNWEQIL